MKKIMALLGITLLSTSISFAIMDDTKTSEIETLRSQGYSESVLRVVDTVKSHNQGPTGKYKRHFSAPNVGVYSHIKHYFDPIQEDDQFGEHEINFSNNWNGDETRYTTTKRDGSFFERL
ncbi:MAG: hypothetical protein IJB79_07305 [Candidatus Gastranaerophilales bacterium]|nr:hypothetical protein [Candidatus Gastranaerophilales bacterium]